MERHYRDEWGGRTIWGTGEKLPAKTPKRGVPGLKEKTRKQDTKGLGKREGEAKRCGLRIERGESLDY